MSLCHKLWIFNPHFFGTQCRKSLIIQTYIIWSNRIHSLKYLRSTTLESKDIGFRKAEFVAKTQFLWMYNIYIKEAEIVKPLKKRTFIEWHMTHKVQELKTCHKLLFLSLYFSHLMLQTLDNSNYNFSGSFPFFASLDMYTHQRNVFYKDLLND